MSVLKFALPSAVRISRGHDGTPLEVGGVWPQLKRKQLLRPNLPQNGVRWQMVLLGRGHHGPSRRQAANHETHAAAFVVACTNDSQAQSRSNQGRIAGSACDERDRHFFTGSLHRLRPRRHTKLRARRPSVDLCSLDGCFCFSCTALDHKRGPGLRKQLTMGRAAALLSGYLFISLSTNSPSSLTHDILRLSAKHLAVTKKEGTLGSSCSR